MAQYRYVALALVACFLVAWLFRYEVKVGDGVQIYKTDRWTGSTIICNTGRCARFPEE